MINFGKVRETVKLKRELRNFKLPRRIKALLNILEKKGFSLGIIPKNGDFSEYIDYVLKNKRQLRPEDEYVKRILSKGGSWGEILIIKNKREIVASFGPNRVEKDQDGRKRARPGYFTVLPKFRNKKLGTVLWWFGLERMKKMGADYVKCSVEKGNLLALKIYLGSGMKIGKRSSSNE